MPGTSSALAEATQTAVLRSDAVNPNDEAKEFGRYLPIEEIGRGAMGLVLRAYDPRLHREVALKVVHGQSSAADRAEFLSEAQAMARLAHPNVVAVYDAETVADNVIIAMELVRGTTLREWLHREHPWRDIVKAFTAAGHGLAAAHEAGLLHRDFKPANVLMGDDGRVRVTDFGIATRGDASSLGTTSANEVHMPVEAAASSVVGTPAYMAPEQHEAGALGPAADQYAFCVALWGALTGHLPFETGDLADLLANKRKGPPPWPHNVSVKPAVRAALIRGLAVDPSERWPSMPALLGVLTEQSRRRHTSSIVAAGVLGIPVLGLAAWSVTHRHLETCSGAEAQLADVWGPARSDDLAAALRVTGPAYAEGVAARVVAKLDEYAHSWKATHVDACRASSIEKRQTVEVMDMRMACLQRSKADLRAAVELLARPDDEVLQRADAIVAALPALELCSDVERLRAEVPLPAPADEEVVRLLQAELAETKALRHAGKYPDALARARALSERVRAVSYPPLRIEALIELGTDLAHANDYTASETALKDALRIALANALPSAAAVAATRLLGNVGALQTRAREGLVYEHTVVGLLTPDDLAGQAAYRSERGMVLEKLGAIAEAESEFRTALELARRLDDAEVVSFVRQRVAMNLVNQGRLDEAEQEQRALLVEREATLGPAHPEVASARYTLGHTLYEQGRYAEAETDIRTALEAWEQALGPDHGDTAAARSTLAYALTVQGREAEAEVEFRAALRAQRAAFGPDHMEVSYTQGSFGTLLMNMGRPAEAEEHIRSALAIAEKALPNGHPTISQARSLLVMVLVRQQRWQQAEPQARKVVESLGRVHGFEHPTLPLAHHNLAAALHGLSRDEEAEAQSKAALRLAQKLLPADHPHVATFQSLLGEILLARGKHAEAVPELERALALGTEVFRSDDRRLVATRQLLAKAKQERPTVARK